MPSAPAPGLLRAGRRPAPSMQKQPRRREQPSCVWVQNRWHVERQADRSACPGARHRQSAAPADEPRSRSTEIRNPAVQLVPGSRFGITAVQPTGICPQIGWIGQHNVGLTPEIDCPKLAQIGTSDGDLPLQPVQAAFRVASSAKSGCISTASICAYCPRAAQSSATIPVPQPSSIARLRGARGA